MRNLIYLIIRYSAFILFILLECLSFYLIVNYNRSQKEIWSHSSNLLSGNLSKRVEKVQDYFSLQKQNDSLLNVNVKLQEKIINYRVTSQNNAFQEFESRDSLLDYRLIPAMVCGKTINLRNNFYTLCTGSEDGVETGMGVMSDNGVVGIVKSVSKHFATVQLVINSQSNISAKVLDSNYPGTMVWNDNNPMILNMIEMPRHAVLEIGDTIVTSGYSFSFPPGLFIGTVSNFEIQKENQDYKIDVQMDQDLAALEYVYLIDYTYIEEKREMLDSQNE